MKTLAAFLVLGIILLFGLGLTGVTTDIPAIDRAVTSLMRVIG